MRHVDADALVLGVHADGVDRAGVDDAAEAVAEGRLPYVVGADEVGPEQRLEGRLVDDGAEVHDDVDALE